MGKIAIDMEKCAACGVCVKVCTKKVFQQEDCCLSPVVVNEDGCKDCGHCVSVCPSGAIFHDCLGEQAYQPLDPIDIAPEHIEYFLKTKRSLRNYIDKPVEKEVIEKIIDTARFAPSDKNYQDRGFIVITDRDRIRAMDKAVCASFAKLMKILSPFARKLLSLSMPAMMKNLEKAIPSLKNLVKLSSQGSYPVFYDAPCVVIITGPKGNMLAKDTSVSAQQYMMLHAQALGVGSCMIGYASTRPNALQPFVSVPKGHQILTVTTLGYPGVKFHKTVSRKPADISWM